MRILNLFFIFFLFLFSCSSKKELKEIDPTSVVSKEVIGSTLKLDDPVLFPKGISVVDSLLFVYEAKQKDGFLSVYSLNSNKLLNKFGTCGGGPNDFQTIRYLQNTFIHDNQEFLFGDETGLYVFQIDSLLSGKFYRNKVLDISKELAGYNYLIHYTDSLVVVNQTGDAQLSFFNCKSKTVAKKSYYKRFETLGNLSDFAYSTQVYDGFYASNGAVISIAYKNFKSIDFVSVNGNLLKKVSLTGSNYNLNKIKLIDEANISIEDGIVYYTYTFPTKEKLYALCWNADKKKIREGIVNPEIHVFNWKGDLLSILKLDTPVSYFCVNQKGDRIYAIGLDKKMDFQIYQFVLSTN